MKDLGEKQEALLREAVVKKEQTLVTHSMAKRVYGSNSGAKKALSSLESRGILTEVEGSHRLRFEITNLPEELYNRWIE